MNLLEQPRIQAQKLSHELRRTTDPDLQRRRWIVGLSFVGAALAKMVSLYQFGMIRRLPDLPLPAIDSNKVDAAPYAYRRFSTPDSFVMHLSYAFTACLAAAGGRDRARQTPILPIVTGLKTLADTAVAAELGREEWKENKALCAYCQAATLCSLASVALAIPETWRAIKALLRR